MSALNLSSKVQTEAKSEQQIRQRTNSAVENEINSSLASPSFKRRAVFFCGKLFIINTLNMLFE